MPGSTRKAAISRYGRSRVSLPLGDVGREPYAIRMGDLRISVRMTSRPALAGFAILLAGCEKKVEVQPPPRIEAKADLPKQNSTIEAPIAIRMADIQAAVNRAAPKVLWRINQREERCVPSQRILKRTGS